jgi:hypothetical protein
MKEVLSRFTVAVGVLCFIVFLDLFKPDAISAVPEPAKLAHCSTEAWSPNACHPPSLLRWPRIFRTPITAFSRGPKSRSPTGAAGSPTCKPVTQG